MTKKELQDKNECLIHYIEELHIRIAKLDASLDTVLSNYAVSKARADVKTLINSYDL